uniref:Uncharacterized protein n=1 Tax=Pseudomonas syringae group genomosp. 3 TaxID=251701 RepID=A0A330JXD0_9PSED|nr:hypothetical protein PSCFBP3800_P200080 [Pseudomonas syringae group genomosp. 3]
MANLSPIVSEFETDVHGGDQRADGAGTGPQRSGDRADEVREALTGGRCVRT